MTAKELREGMGDMVKYLLPKEDHHKDTIESYTDTLVNAAEEYVKTRLNDQAEFSYELMDQERLKAFKHGHNASLEEIKEVEYASSKWVSVGTPPELNQLTSEHLLLSDWVLTFDKDLWQIDKAYFSNVTGWQAEHGEKINPTHWQPLLTPPIQS